MAVALKAVLDAGFRPLGDLLFFAVADEEAGSAHGTQWIADNHWDSFSADYVLTENVLTENGGLHSGTATHPVIGINIAKKGVAWRRLRSDSLQTAVSERFQASRLSPQMAVGITDARVCRSNGSVAYGAGLFSPDLDGADFAQRFHGNDERIDIDSLALTTQLWLDVIHEMMG